MLRFDRATLTKTRRTPEGHLLCEAAIARAGVQTYGLVAEFRPPEEVFDALSMASLRGVPLVVGHVPALTLPRGDPRIVGHVGDDVRRDGDHVTATVTVTDPATIARIESGELRELSSGYHAVIDNARGVAPCGVRYDRVQRKIRHGHVALLPPGAARCGSSCALRVDSSGSARVDSGSARDRMIERHRNLWRQS